MPNIMQSFFKGEEEEEVLLKRSAPLKSHACTYFHVAPLLKISLTCI